MRRRPFTPGRITVRGALLLYAVAATNADPGGLDAAETPRRDPASPDRYDVTWASPSRDAFGSVPLGNGEVAANAWFEPGGDLCLYISRTDSWGDNGRLLKVGKVRVRFRPWGPPEPGSFRQRLRLRDATLEVRVGEGPGALEIEAWIDAHHPVIHVEASSGRAVEATATIELWRTERAALPSIEVSDVLLDRSRPGSQREPTVVEPDVLLRGLPGRIGWYHHNRKSVGPALTARVQGLADFERPDPLLHRTFGAVVRAAGGERVDERTLRSPPSRRHRLDIFALTRHPSTPAGWQAAVEAAIARFDERSAAARRAEHATWWREFWARSWIHVTGSGERSAPVPANAHPVRVGVDPTGGNRLRGEVGRLTVHGRALTDAELETAARTDHRRLPAVRDGALWGGRPEIGVELPGSADWDLSRGVTIEAWVRPEKLPASGARIVDKITPGGSDGLLLDTWPGNSLRLIVGRQILTAKDVLPAGRWTHVSARVDPKGGGIDLRVDGREVARRGFETLDDAALVSRAYALQRYVNACAGRGRYPIKFNGSLFTVPWEGRPGDADYRRWGPGYWWQNTRLPYIGMCASGDFDLMAPLFRMYARDLLPLFRHRTERYFGHGGIFIPECIYFWGDVFSESYGWTPFEEREDKLQESGWHKWEWVSGPELVHLMLEYHAHTEDDSFLRETVLPVARDVLAFFELHYPVDERGRLVMHPSQALETWWTCTNPMPEVAGLQAVTDRLLALDEGLVPEEDRRRWSEFRRKIPPLPIREVDGRRMLAPAETFANKRNIENPELYAVYPFRRVALGRGDVEAAIEALRRRPDRGHAGWRQDGIFMAWLGLAEDARSDLVARARTRHEGSRFPAFWGPNYDWVPDQDHGGTLIKTLQSMVLQADGDRILVLPAWPEDWDVRFRLHAPGRTVVEGEFRGGEVRALEVTPTRRARDVVRGSGQEGKAVPGVR